MLVDYLNICICKKKEKKSEEFVSYKESPLIESTTNIIFIVGLVGGRVYYDSQKTHIP